MKLADKVRKIAKDEKNIRKQRKIDEADKRREISKKIETIDGFSEVIADMVHSHFKPQNTDDIQNSIEKLVRKDPEIKTLRIENEVPVGRKLLLRNEYFLNNHYHLAIRKGLRGAINSRFRDLIAWCKKEGYRIEIIICNLKADFRVDVLISW
jgi:hypothetical protein